MLASGGVKATETVRPADTQGMEPHRKPRRPMPRQGAGPTTRRRSARWGALVALWVLATLAPSPAGAATAPPLVQPATASIAAALDTAALNALPTGYPRLGS